MKILTTDIGETIQNPDEIKMKSRAIITNSEGKILIGNYGGVYLLPGGSMEDGENSNDTILRELREETGFEFQQLEPFAKIRYFQNNYPTRDGRTIDRLLITYYYIGREKNAIKHERKLTEKEIKDGFELKYYSVEEIERILEQNQTKNPRNEYFNKEIKILIGHYMKEKNEYVDELCDRLSVVYDFQSLKSKIEECLTEDVELISENMESLLILIPEIKNMIGFEHKHPHHHLDVWQHTLEVLKNLNSKDLELNMAALLHDIGKPFSYQDEAVRHFHGHPKISCKIAQQILTRLGYDEEFIKRVSYLIETHDTIIDPSNLDNSFEMIQKRLQLQYADAKAHHPDKIEKRIKFLDGVKAQLQELENTER